MYYDGAHSVTFESLDGEVRKNTWDDWYLIPMSRPTMSIPGAQNKFVEIPGMDGSYDISDYLRDDTAFTDRSGSFEFVVDNEHADWLTIYRDIITFLHGQRFRMILQDDPDWYYEGRFTMGEWKSEPARSQVTISYRVSPFKHSIYSEFVDKIIWDTFCFERDMDWSSLYHVELTNGETKTFDIPSYGVKHTVSIRLVSGSVTAVYGGYRRTIDTPDQVKTLGTGSRTGTDILTVTGTGVFDIGWQKWSL